MKKTNKFHKEFKQKNIDILIYPLMLSIEAISKREWFLCTYFFKNDIYSLALKDLNILG